MRQKWIENVSNYEKCNFMLIWLYAVEVYA